MALDYFERKKQGKLIPRKTTLSQEVKKSIYMLMVTLLAIIILLSTVLLLNTSQTYQKGYILQAQQLDKEKLQLANREIIDKIVKAMAYSKLENNPIILGMTKVENPQYIENKDETTTPLAKKNPAKKKSTTNTPAPQATKTIN